MSKVTPANLREWFPLDLSDVPDGRLQFCIGDAARTLKTWIGAANYDLADNADAVKSAEGKLAIYHLLLNSGVRIRQHGLVKQEADSGGNLGGATHSYYDTQDIIRLRKAYYEEALASIETLKISTVGSRNNSVLIRGGWAN